MTNPFSLQGKTLLITGASSGIGRQTAITASQLGAQIVLTGRNQAALESTQASLSGTGHQSIPADLTQATDRQKLVAACPPLQGVVHSAGITSHMPVKFLRPEDLQQLLDINFQVPVLLNALLLQKKRISRPAAVVFVSSIAAQYPYFGGALYSGSKAALEAYSKTLSMEWAAKGIRSNCVAPSFIKTPMIEQTAETVSQASLDRFEKIHPLGFGEPEDVAHSIVFLLSDAAKWITGTTLKLGGV